ncbi:MAG: Cof-type HAD-IIB family hydrolase [Anaerovoracaceae bacterium]
MKKRPVPEKISLIALDLDGTTLVRGRITPRTRRALETAVKKGIHVVIATGRAWCALPKDIFRIRGLEYVVTSNGAMITDLRSGEVIYENCIDPEPLKQVAGLLRENSRFPVEVFTGGKAYIGRPVFEDIRDHGSTYMSRSYILRTRQPVDQIYDFLEEHISAIENINIHFEEFEDKAAMKEILEQIPDITVTSSVPHNLEIGGATTSKASGLAALCRILHTDLSSAMACGDSPNDMAMLAEVGLGVAMGNGEPEVRAMADFVAPSNEDEGVALAVERFALGVERPAWQLAAFRVRNRVLYRLRKLARRLVRRMRGK